MNLENDDFWARYKWHIIVICSVSVIVALFLAFNDRLQTSETNFYTQILWLIGALVVLAALLTMLTRVIKILDALKDNSAKLEELTQAFEQIHIGLAQINKSTRISDTVKSIAFKDADRQSLKEVVFEKLQAKEFNAAKEIIEEIEKHPEYCELAEELKEQADQYQNATEQERMNQIISHIEKLIDDAQWTRASAQIEGLVKANPGSEQARNMRLVLYERKQERKRILLAAWDDAVTSQETDRSLAILKELDSYLTPSEATALQEAASDIFRIKLHTLGVQFSMAVSERRWADALDVGQKIIKDFPNSKMCQEIYAKLDVLKQNVDMQKI